MVHKERVGKNGVFQYSIVIQGPLSKETFKNLVAPHMHNSMLYRVGLLF